MRLGRVGLVLGGIAVVVLVVGYFTPLGPFAVTALPVGAGVSAQLACGSPSETVSVIDAVPADAHVNVGFCAVALLSVPELVVQL